MISRSRRRRMASNLPWQAALIVILLVFSAWLNQFFVNSSPSPKRPVPSTQPHPYLTYFVAPGPSTTPSLPFKIGESSGILWNLNTHQLLWKFHAHQQGSLASTTKLMTFYLIWHHVPLTRTVTVSPQAAATTGSDIYMATGEHYTVRQLLYGLMLASANDAAVALAENMSGARSRFVAAMNRQARQFGMNGTTYADPDGLSPESRGTAWDLSIIVQQDLRIPLFRQIVDTKVVSLPHNPVVRNLNSLLFLDPSVTGVKTGWTTQAGFNLVFTATRNVDGQPVTLLGVILHGQHGFPPENQDAEKILQWGFHQVAQKMMNSRLER